MSERSDHLRRQRDLLKEHLAWIERELTSEGQDFPTDAPPRVSPVSATLPPFDPSDAEAILAQYRQPATSVARRTKMGCFLYFVGALVLLIVVVTAVYFYAKAIHPR